MGGLLNRIRRFVDDDGRPTVLGFHAIGDAHTCTNPLYGRGCSLAVVQALLVADAFAAHPDDPAARALAYESGSRREVEPWYDVAVQMDELGADPNSPGIAGPGGKALAAVFVAAATDPVIGRGLARFWNLLATPNDLMADAELLERMATVMADPDAYPIPPRAGPSRTRAARGDRCRRPECSLSGERPVSGTEITTRTLAVNGVELHVTEAGSGPPVILAHGFPELAYSWRHQLPALAGAGFHAVAPDQRGYGRSSRPDGGRGLRHHRTDR